MEVSIFLHNYWYAAAFQEDVGRRLLLGTFLNENAVVYRLEDGTSVALEDSSS